jgi:hypothetical protein
MRFERGCVAALSSENAGNLSALKRTTGKLVEFFVEKTRKRLLSVSRMTRLGRVGMYAFRFS